jgi:hypothetical protein
MLTTPIQGTAVGILDKKDEGAYVATNTTSGAE